MQACLSNFVIVVSLFLAAASSSTSLFAGPSVGPLFGGHGFCPRRPKSDMEVKSVGVCVCVCVFVFMPIG